MSTDENLTKLAYTVPELQQATGLGRARIYEEIKRAACGSPRSDAGALFVTRTRALGSRALRWSPRPFRITSLLLDLPCRPMRRSRQP